MKIFNHYLLLFIMAGLAITCNTHSPEKQATLASDDFAIVPLNEFKYEPALIKPGTEVEILASLSGLENSGDTVFYYQFIVINKGSGDTIRILTPEITVEDEGVNKTSTSPASFNFSKGVTTATYELIDSTKSLLLNGNNLDKMTANDDSVDITHLLDNKNVKAFVVEDKHASARANTMFKTAIGILNFKKIPW